MKQKITELLYEAMKKGDKVPVSVYRSLKADIENAEKNGELNAFIIINKAYKRRLDSAAAYQECGRGDLMEAELLEADIIKRLLPKEPTDEDLMKEVKLIGDLHGKNMGMIIKTVKSKFPTADGKKLASMVKEFISK